MRKWHGAIAAAGLGGLLACLVTAANGTPTQAEQNRLWDEVGRVALKGPADVPLFDQAVLHLPAGEVFVPQPQADRLLALFGNPGRNPDMPGLILPRDPKATWFMPVHFRATGYIKDDDARQWNADEMLVSLRTGTDEQNIEREKAGIPKMDIVGWSSPPSYDPATQRLAWALTSQVAGARPDEPRIVNYNTYLLGRDGYFTMSMVGGFADLPILKPVAEQQLVALAYNAGKRYTDFNAATDPTAAFGLASLVVGTTQPRAGFVPAARAFTTKFMKFIVPCVAVLLVAFVILWRRRRAVVAVEPAAAPFAPTVAEIPGRTGPEVDLDLGDKPAGADATHRAV
jgi:uncharacterized membrane-anchored protein